MKHLVIGCGETGAPLATHLSEKRQHVYKHDPKIGFEARVDGVIDVMHVCIPWSDGFIRFVEYYAQSWIKSHLDHQLVVIHSTVPVGTTQKMIERGIDAVHSPIRGMHMSMLKDLDIYPKMVGYDSERLLEKSKAMLSPCFRSGTHLEDSRTTELGKILELSRYGLNISFAREQEEVCRGLGLNYHHVVGRFVQTHNAGMDSRGTPRFRQQEVYPPDGPIGGHCVLPGMRLLTEQFSPFIISHAYGRERMVANEHMRDEVFVSPYANVSPDSIIGKGTKIWEWTKVREGALIGEDCSLGQGCYVAERAVIGARTRIGNGVSVFNGVAIEQDCFIGPHVVFTNDKYPPSDVETPTLVEKGAAIGAGAIIICGVRIGAGAKIGAGSVVTKDVPPGEVWVGNPAAKLKDKR